MLNEQIDDSWILDTGNWIAARHQLNDSLTTDGCQLDDSWTAAEQQLDDSWTKIGCKDYYSILFLNMNGSKLRKNIYI
jgi:hypothetical protein